MLLRFSLIAAILAGVVTLFVSHFYLAEKLTTLKTDLQTTSDNLRTSQEEEAKAKKEAKTAKEKEEKTAKDLAETSTKLETETSRATTQEARANKAETELNDARGKLTDAQRALSAWQALGRPVDQIEKSLAELVKARESIEALGEEKKVMNRTIKNLQAKVDIYEGQKDLPPDMPAVKGKVVQVDPKWDFVVLDVGGNQGLVQRGELLVNRAGKLVAKLRITSVEANRAIANVLPEWKQTDVMEGDEVLH